ncbi:TPA: cobalamin biosynthesis protein [Streptococcus suis]|nr:cobalamin biosynthesis protein [Streptococcus suis]HEM5489833.1 cobalamin biosynthesis protein [Streptococcus suis]
MYMIAIFIAILLDWLLGDPYSWPHPVKLIGNFISLFLKGQPNHPKGKYIYGFFLWLTTVGMTVGVSYFLLSLSARFSPVLYWGIWIYLAYTTLSTRCLAMEALKVLKTLKTGTIEEARYQVSMIVGRDTSQLTAEEISKAAIETVAENTSDGVIGPLLCLFIGGPVLAMAYKAVNTLDSMVGYKTEKYRQIGFVSAKLDDVANLIPARLTWLSLMIASHILQLDSKEACRIGFRDRYQHASPNSAFSEAVVAGALGIQLGGAHIYHGEWVDKPTIGDAVRPVEFTDIQTTIQMLYMSTTVSLLLFSAVYLLLTII